MKIWIVFMAFMFTFVAIAPAQYTSPSADFFLHDRFYDTFLRDHFRFEEPKPLRIEYFNINWLDTSNALSEEYMDYLNFEGMIPIYTRPNLIIDIPFRFRHVPIWAEDGEDAFGASMNVLEPHLMAHLTFTDRFKAIAGLEYNLQGDSEYFGKSIGRKICFLKSFFSYDLNSQFNVVAGARFDRYYYDHEAISDELELANRLYCRPSVMLNWHPGDNLKLLLGLPAVGAHIGIGDMLKLEARADINKKAEIAVSFRPVERIIAMIRLFNTPYEEMPVEISGEGEPLIEMLGYTDKNVLLEVGWKLNPAALASAGFRYSPGGDMEFRDRANESITKEMDCKASYAIGATFTMGIEALLGMR